VLIQVNQCSLPDQAIENSHPEMFTNLSTVNLLQMAQAAAVEADSVRADKV
jgi:hypothetical protein